MKINIVTVAYKRAAAIADTLRSVTAQGHGDIEHLVIDIASVHNTLHIVRACGARALHDVACAMRRIGCTRHPGTRATKS